MNVSTDGFIQDTNKNEGVFVVVRSGLWLLDSQYYSFSYLLKKKTQTTEQSK